MTIVMTLAQVPHGSDYEVEGGGVSATGGVEAEFPFGAIAQAITLSAIYTALALAIRARTPDQKVATDLAIILGESQILPEWQMGHDGQGLIGEIARTSSIRMESLSRIWPRGNYSRTYPEDWKGS